MSTKYGINIGMDQTTVEELDRSNYNLFGFKGVQTTLKGGAPLIWFQTDIFSKGTQISWTEQYQAYTSRDQIIANGQISAGASYDIDLAQTLRVTNNKGTGEVFAEGASGAISILNKTDTPFTGGISQVQGVNNTAKSTSPLCAFPLHGNGLDVMAPIQLVLLTFSTNPVNTGTVIFKAYSQGILIDLTESSQRAVSFDINKGWSWGGGAWAKKISADEELVPLLIK